jgi:hypothetical protein
MIDFEAPPLRLIPMDRSWDGKHLRVRFSIDALKGALGPALGLFDRVLEIAPPARTGVAPTAYRWIPFASDSTGRDETVWVTLIHSEVDLTLALGSACPACGNALSQIEHIWRPSPAAIAAGVPLEYGPSRFSCGTDPKHWFPPPPYWSPRE